VTDTFDNRLAALRQRFRDRASAESDALEGIVADLERGAPGTLLQAEIRRIAHSLAGAGEPSALRRSAPARRGWTSLPAICPIRPSFPAPAAR
jgi:hypothetical protein